MRIKVASRNGSVANYAPEYEDCRRIAAEKHVPLKSVMQEAIQQFLQTRSAKEEEITTKDTKVHEGKLS